MPQNNLYRMTSFKSTLIKLLQEGNSGIRGGQVPEDYYCTTVIICFKLMMFTVINILNYGQLVLYAVYMNLHIKQADRSLFFF